MCFCYDNEPDDQNDPNWMTGGPWYNTYICKNYMEQC